jgi:DNA-binding MarR family transcriptional regulator
VVGGRWQVVGARAKAVAGGRVRRGIAPDSRRGPLPELDRVIHERIRLAIAAALAANERLSFNELKALLGTTDGNLSVHARKLEDAGYVALEKSFEGRKPRTEYRLTAEGRKAFERYLNHLEALVRGATRHQRTTGASPSCRKN